MSSYYAVTRSDSKTDELKHFKYIKRVKKNGKWRYYYDESSNKLKNLEEPGTTIEVITPEPSSALTSWTKPNL